MRFIIVIVLLALGAMPVQAQAPPANPIGDPVAAFIAATRDYAAMHRRVEQQLPALTVTSNPETIRRAVDVMSSAMRAARADAKQGDFFTPRLAIELRARVNEALLEHGFTSEDLHFAEWLEGINPSTARLAVNDSFPWALGSAMFPCVTAALPPLPPELQYRVVGNTLVLIDVHASLIVDLLPSVLIESNVTDLDCGILRDRPKNPRRY